jgi:hypothetical protein
MKDNLSAYEYKPEMMSNLEPGPEYPEKSLGQGYLKEKRMRDGHHTLERHRTAEISARANYERFTKGRLYSHLKLEQMRKDVLEIKQLEKEESEVKGRARNLLGGQYEHEIDDTF